MVRLEIAVVHNHDGVRTAYLLPRLASLATELGASFRAVAWQPPARPHPVTLRAWRYLHYAWLASAWSRYCGDGRLASLRVLLREVRNGAGDLLVARRREPSLRYSAIQTLIADKHLLAWRAFLETDATHLMCCEDDLVFKPDSHDRLRAALATAEADDLCYVDLAGGLPLAELGVGQLVDRRDGDRLEFARAAPNTSCGYLMSRRLVEHFMAGLLRRPQLRLVSIDWLVNALLIGLRDAGIACRGRYYVPPVFGHGSFTGEYRSFLSDAAPVVAPAERVL